VCVLFFCSLGDVVCTTRYVSIVVLVKTLELLTLHVARSPVAFSVI